MPAYCPHLVVLVAGLISLQVRLVNNLWFSGKCADTDSFDLSGLRPEQVLLLFPVLYSSYETVLKGYYHQLDAEIPHRANFRYAVIVYAFQVHKRSNKCSRFFQMMFQHVLATPNPQPVLFFSCVHVCFYRREVTSS